MTAGLFAASASAQSPEAADTLTILPEGALRPLAVEVARSLERRTGLEVLVGAEPPILPEAVTTHELAMVSAGEGAVLLATGRNGGGTVTRELAVEGTAADAFPVALAVEALRDEAAIPAPPSPPPPSNAYVYYEYERPPVEREMRAVPTLYMKVLAGYSPVRNHWLVGPGAGLGLCIEGHCLVIEADLPLLPEEVRSEELGTFRYRAVSTSLRLQIRPVIREAWSFGLTLGALSRMGNATWVEADLRRRATNFGGRASAELALRLAGPFELVVETGIDLLKDRASFRHGSNVVFLEDRFTPWTTLSLRMRPLQ